MNLMEIATGLLADKLGIDRETAVGGLQKLFGDGSGQIDIAGLVGMLQQGGLSDIVGSWLGDGGNASVSPESLQDAIGTDRINDAATSMGVESGSLLGGLSDILPQVVDQASSGGNLLEGLGGMGSVADLAKKLF